MDTDWLIGLVALVVIFWAALHDNRVEQPPEQVTDDVEDEKIEWWRHLL